MQHVIIFKALEGFWKPGLMDPFQEWLERDFGIADVFLIRKTLAGLQRETWRSKFWAQGVSWREPEAMIQKCTRQSSRCEQGCKKWSVRSFNCPSPFSLVSELHPFFVFFWARSIFDSLPSSKKKKKSSIWCSGGACTFRRMGKQDAPKNPCQEMVIFCMNIQLHLRWKETQKEHPPWIFLCLFPSMIFFAPLLLSRSRELVVGCVLFKNRRGIQSEGRTRKRGGGGISRFFS